MRTETLRFRTSLRSANSRALYRRSPGNLHPVFVLMVFLSGLFACTKQEDSRTALGILWDSAGVEIVEHPSVSEYGSPTYRVDYLLRVSDTLPSGAGEFGMVTDVTMLPDGSLVVLDGFSAEMRVFSRGGDFLRRIGRRGQGPGELSGRGTLGILSVSSGRLAVPDVLNQAIVVFDAAGSHLSNVRWDVMKETIPQWCALSGDTVLVLVTTEETNSLVKRTLDDAWRDTLVVEPVPVQGPTPPDGRSPLFTNHTVWSASSHPDLLVLSQMAHAKLALFEGKTLRRVIRWSPEHPELTEADVDAILGVVAGSLGDPEAKRETALQYFAPPKRSPALADVQLGPGIVMVQRLRPFNDMDRRILSTLRATGYGGRFWDVFTWAGEYLGALDYGENVEVFRVRGDTVAGIQEDSLGVARPFLALLPRELSLHHAGE